MFAATALGIAFAAGCTSEAEKKQEQQEQQAVTGLHSQPVRTAPRLSELSTGVYDVTLPVTGGGYRYCLASTFFQHSGDNNAVVLSCDEQVLQSVNPGDTDPRRVYIPESFRERSGNYQIDVVTRKGSRHCDASLFFAHSGNNNAVVLTNCR